MDFEKLKGIAYNATDVETQETEKNQAINYLLDVIQAANFKDEQYYISSKLSELWENLDYSKQPLPQPNVEDGSYEVIQAFVKTNNDYEKTSQFRKGYFYFTIDNDGTIARHNIYDYVAIIYDDTELSKVMLTDVIEYKPASPEEREKILAAKAKMTGPVPIHRNDFKYLDMNECLKVYTENKSILASFLPKNTFLSARISSHSQYKGLAGYVQILHLYPKGNFEGEKQYIQKEFAGEKFNTTFYDNVYDTWRSEIKHLIKSIDFDNELEEMLGRLYATGSRASKGDAFGIVFEFSTDLSKDQSCCVLSQEKPNLVFKHDQIALTCACHTEKSREFILNMSDGVSVEMSDVFWSFVGKENSKFYINDCLPNLDDDTLWYDLSFNQEVEDLLKEKLEATGLHVLEAMYEFIDEDSCDLKPCFTITVKNPIKYY